MEKNNEAEELKALANDIEVEEVEEIDAPEIDDESAFREPTADER